MHTKTGYKPAKKSVVLALLCGATLLVLVFAGLLRYTLRTATPLNPAQYQQYTPEGFAWRVTDEAGDGVITFKGWACVEGERFESVETYVVLYNTETGAYLQAPTTMELNEEPLEVLGDPDHFINYTRGGFAGFVLLKQLTSPPAAYEICFAYRSNGYNALVHTGQHLQGV